MAGRQSSLYKTNLHKYTDAMNDVVRKEVCRVFLWLYQGGNKYVGDYLGDIQGGRKGLTKTEKDKLKNRENPANMDISLLYRLLQHTCGLAEVEDPVWTDDSSPSLEHTLYLIKKERNKLSHEGHKGQMSDAELEHTLEHLQSLCATLLTEAAKRCGRLHQTNTLIDSMKARLREIQGVTPETFLNMAREEMLRRPEMAGDWYLQPLLMLQGRPVGLDGLLQGQAGGGGLLLVSGEAGVGKSSLCRYLEESWLRSPSGVKDLLQCYRLVLRIHCRDICTSDKVRLLKEELLPEAASQCSSDTLSEVLRSEPILWLLDGLDEATKEANTLLSSFLRNRRQQSTVVLTSRPEFGQDFLRQHSNQGIQSVTLLGTDPCQAIERIIPSTACDEDTVRHATTLTEEFRKLDKGVQQELRNPLKLLLALQDWEALRTSTLRREFELSRLYQKITDKQIESLSEKMSDMPSMTTSEATRKVRKWFSFLCECTFHLVQARRPFTAATRDEFLNKLEDKCDHLRISSSKCMSTFLASPDSVFSTGHGRYTFYHDSQVHFLAALHIASVMRHSNHVHADTLTLFNNVALQEHASEEPPLQHFHHVLLLLVSLIDASTPDDNIRMVIKLLLNAIPLNDTEWMWFVVAEKASYEHKVMREIGRVMSDGWFITETSIEAARRLIVYRQPSSVLLCVSSKPEELKDLKPLIHTLASLPIAVGLLLHGHYWDVSGNNTSDAHLEIICSKKSRCVLKGFTGCLGDRGYDLLQRQNVRNSCGVMGIKVTSVKSLETLAKRVQNFKFIKTINLVIAMKELSDTSAKFPNISVSIHLPFMTEETAGNTAKLVAQLSQSYDSLVVYDMHESGIKKFLQILRKKRVTVKGFSGLLNAGEVHTRSYPFGSLPLEYTWKEFQQHWSLYRSLVQRVRLTTDP